MSKVMSVTMPEDVYSRLEQSSTKMGLTKSGYINYCLRQVFNQEDVMDKMPDILDQMRVLSSQLKERNEK